MKRFLLVASVIVLANCASQSSPESHARHYAYSVAESHDANLVVDKYGTAKAYLPMFEAVYDVGRLDRGVLSEAQALRKAEVIRNTRKDVNARQSQYNPNKSHTFLDYYSPKEANALYDGLAETYLDGYHGK
ncbi:TPA: Exc2 family lipoprotein [Enterobacter hormaechei subsp. xiangfangensis]|nr:Exc2 family lipoprotein [Enterobacter hormaechei subsp. xiangfangensis]HAV1890557.1 Exc2 family lipoprotein [Enterobacter hormaechei subsp. xiangfangensis]